MTQTCHKCHNNVTKVSNCPKLIQIDINGHKWNQVDTQQGKKCHKCHNNVTKVLKLPRITCASQQHSVVTNTNTDNTGNTDNTDNIDNTDNLDCLDNTKQYRTAQNNTIQTTQNNAQPHKRAKKNKTEQHKRV